MINYHLPSRLSMILLVLFMTGNTLGLSSSATNTRRTSRNAANTGGIAFRPGKRSDELQISFTMARNLMNPLGIDSQRFMVAVDPNNDQALYGWAQLRPIGTAIRDPKEYDSLPGSGSVEREIEEEIWDDFFENDEMEFPNGFASFPWTKEYREFSEASARRREKRLNLIEQAEREKKRNQKQLWELASVFVLPEWRSKGIGSELIRKVMAKHTMLNRSANDVYLLTLDTTKDWYRGFGFEVTDEPPSSMALEMAAGRVLTNMIGAKLVAMQGGERLK